MPHTWSKGLTSANACHQCLKGFFHLPVLRKLGISPSENGIFAFPLLNGMVETPDAPSYALLRSGL